MNNIFIITLFESYFDGLLNTGVVGMALRGERADLPQIKFINPSDYSAKGFKGVDSSPYGGGAGQVMRADVLENCLLKGLGCSGLEDISRQFEVIYLGPRGEVFNQQLAQQLNNEFLVGEDRKDLVFICGRYEGVDERFLQTYVRRTISLGDFVLSGGEVALGVILDAIFRLAPGVLSNSTSPLDESFSGGLLEYPQYTKPQVCCGKEVPKVLLSGNHQKIKQWRYEQKLTVTKTLRPELFRAFEGKEKE
jgi:tRNA (guanine37-N1)-methyltransferase